MPPHGEQLGIWAVLCTAPFLAMKRELCISYKKMIFARACMLQKVNGQEYSSQGLMALCIAVAQFMNGSCSGDVGAHHSLP